MHFVLQVKFKNRGVQVNKNTFPCHWMVIYREIMFHVVKNDASDLSNCISYKISHGPLILKVICLNLVLALRHTHLNSMHLEWHIRAIDRSCVSLFTIRFYVARLL